MTEPSGHKCYPVRLEGLAVGGRAVGQALDGEDRGKKCFIAYGIPGEVVTARTERVYERYLEAELVSVNEPSPHRVTPQCPYFGKCGGCQLQHVDIAFQRELKRRLVEGTLLHHGKSTVHEGVVLTGEDLPAYGYRRRVNLHRDDLGRIGFYESGSRRVVDIAVCPISTSLINRGLKILRDGRDALGGIGTIILEESRGALHAVFRVESTPFDPEMLVDRFGPHLESFKLTRDSAELFSYGSTGSTGHFSQVNAVANELLVSLVVEQARGRDVTELYAGAGNFSIPLAAAGCNITAVEVDPVLVAEGKRAAHHRKLESKLKFVARSAEAFVRESPIEKCVVMDPPRSGGRGMMEKLARKGVEKIIYVSCNISTLSRDIATLAQSGFRCERVNVIDMFPQTHHVETLTILSRSQ